jgi:hypothetical protein
MLAAFLDYAFAGGNLMNISMMIGQRVNENSASIHYLTTTGMLNWTSKLPELNQTETTNCLQHTGGILRQADCLAPMEFLCEDKYNYTAHLGLYYSNLMHPFSQKNLFRYYLE